MQGIVDPGAMERRSAGDIENGDAFLDLKKHLASKSPHRYTKVGFVTNERVFLPKGGRLVTLCRYFIGLV